MVRVKVRLAQGSDSYVIRDVSAADEGRYFCRTTNAVGYREASVDVRMMSERDLFYFRCLSTLTHKMVRSNEALCQVL
jgi:hypothetical protein